MKNSKPINFHIVECEEDIITIIRDDEKFTIDLNNPPPSKWKSIVHHFNNASPVLSAMLIMYVIMIVSYTIALCLEYK